MNKNIVKLLVLASATLATAALFAPPQPPQGRGPGGFRHKGQHGKPEHGYGWHKGFHHRGPEFFEQERETLKDMVNKITNQEVKKDLLDKIERAKALGDERKENMEKNHVLFEEEIRYLHEVRDALGLPNLPRFEEKPGMGPDIKPGPRRMGEHRQGRGYQRRP